MIYYDGGMFMLSKDKKDWCGWGVYNNNINCIATLESAMTAHFNYFDSSLTSLFFKFKVLGEFPYEAHGSTLQTNGKDSIYEFKHTRCFIVDSRLHTLPYRGIYVRCLT